MNTLHCIRGFLIGGLLAGVAACAGGGGLRLSDVTPEAIPSLEAQRSERPGDANVLARLGVGYFKAERYGDARTVLDTAVSLDSRNGIAAIYLGMTTEQLGDFAAARTAYQQYVTVGRSSTLRNTARQRLALVGRRELEFQAREALAAESSLARTPPDAGTIAVMPFSYTGTNPEIQPLTRGLAQLLITDLARSRQLRVLERERMQAMVNEMRLGDSARTDPQSAVRSGRMLRAERVVQGSLAEVGDGLRADAAVVDVSTAGVGTPANASNQLERLFDLEKALVFGIFGALGIQLSDAERAAIEQRPTANLQAFLAYSRGLEAEDRGDFAGAATAFGEAAALDPGFIAAAQGMAAANDLSAAAGQTVAQVEVAVVQNSAPDAGPPAPSTSDALANTVQTVNPTPTGQAVQDVSSTPTTPPPQRDPTAEGTGTEGPKPTTGTVVIIIRRP